jgi:hypothetical protein
VRKRALALLLLPALAPAGGLADEPPASASVTRAAGARYEAGALHRFLLGTGYRTLWGLPIQVEVLDLAHFSGGLTAHKKGGGKQTHSLKLKGKDGREWKFRSVDKDPETILPKGLHETLASRVVQDQISASHPLGVLVVDPLADAAGVLHVPHRLAVLPDDPRLGEFRAEFAGVLGTLEEDPRLEDPVTPGFERFDRLVDTDELDELLDGGARVDARALVYARLLDLVVGDTDRHRNQWHWGHDTQSGLYVPVPSDRDLAFVRFDGLLLKAARQVSPHLAKFGPGYPRIIALESQAQRVDRRYLSELEWPAWREAAQALQARLTDAVIEAAVARLPEPYVRAEGTRMAASLRSRRDRLEAAARALYELLAMQVEVHGTDGPDTARIARQRDGSVEITLAGAGGTYFRRRFLPGETDEVRVFLKAGDDRAVSEGRGPARVTVRVVGGDGNDVLADGAGHTRFYDDSGDNRVTGGRGTHTSARPYTAPTNADGDPDRDWGSSSGVMPWFLANEDYGAVFGLAFQHTDYGFRKHPYAERHVLRAGYSTAAQAGGVEYRYDSLRTDNRTRLHATAKVSALELLHYYGLGNETGDSLPQSVFDVKQTQYSLAPSYRLDLAAVDVSVGPVVKYADTHDQPLTLLARDRPYGFGRFGQLGARMGISLDRRALREGSETGAMLAVEGAFYPRVWSVTENFGRVGAQGIAYLRAPLPLQPTLALRAGGTWLFGRYPFQEAAQIGGAETVRGLPRERYAGDGSVFGNAELRLLLWRRERSLVPRVGIFGLADVGRVFVAGESSARWHPAWGGGAWIAFLDPKNLASIAVAASEGHARVYLQGGFTF